MMSDAKPTAGPWIVYQPSYSSQLQIRDDAGELIIAAVPEKGDKLRCRADAELLAAAPAMLTALKGILTFLPESWGDYVEGGQLRGLLIEESDIHAALRAIAEAEGGR